MAERLPPGIGLAVVSALLFGLATPAARELLADLSPLMLSALLYLGSGLGLALLALATARGSPVPRLRRDEWLPLAGAILLGGVLAPVCLLAGLQQIGATRASLLLNLEGVFTALLAWRLFDEAADGSVMAGMACVVLACALLAWPEGGDVLPATLAGLRLPGGWLVALACLCWGLDNNLTRSVSHLDARGIAMCKGLVAGSFNLAMARLHGGQWPEGTLVLPALLTGFLGYGLSLVAYVRAQSQLGAARTAAWFGLAPFAGALAALLVLHEATPRFLWPALGLLVAGLYLHLRERHSHWHAHPLQEHGHRHRHDAHHQHAHDFAWDGREPHAHPHRHDALTHAHPHFPDLHHRHGHVDDHEHHPEHGHEHHPGGQPRPGDHAGEPRRARPDAALLAAYRATHYRVEATPSFTLHVDRHSPELAGRMTREGWHCAAFLTACNPWSQPLPAVENAKRLQALREDLLARGFHPVPARGESATGDWAGEDSLLVPDLDRAQALALAREWQQHALLWSGADAVPRLLLSGDA